MAQLPKLSPAQFAIMTVVWDKGETTVNEVLKEINSRRRKKLYRTTILVQMLRLETKGWLTHRKEGRMFYFQASRSREDVQAEIAAEVIGEVFGGSCAELVKCLFDHGRISREEIGQIRGLLDWVKRE